MEPKKEPTKETIRKQSKKKKKNLAYFFLGDSFEKNESKTLVNNK